MEPSMLFFNIDELIYRFHLYIADPIISFFSFEWLTGGGDPVHENSFFEEYVVMPLYRIASSRPSVEHDSVQEYLDPTAHKDLGEILRDMLLGSGDKESVFAIIFTTPLGWILLAVLFAILYRLYLANKIEFMIHKHELLYDLANTGHVQEASNDKAARWQKIVGQINSDDINQWKIAVIDADSLLDEVLYEQGYAQEGVAAKLAAVGKDHVVSTPLAQEAHGVRNRVAHDARYVLTKREAKSAIAGFERFLNELYGN